MTFCIAKVLNLLQNDIKSQKNDILFAYVIFFSYLCTRKG